MQALSIANLPAGTPDWILNLTVTGMVIHVGAGSVAILSGFAALATAKGTSRHRLVGRVFVAAMLITAILATVLAARIPQRGNVAGGTLVVYLIMTAWVTIRRKEGTVGRFEICALLGAVIIAFSTLLFAIQASRSASGTLDGFPPAPYYGLAGIACLFASFDLRLILRRGVSGASRLARHLGRMCAALFIASGSFFVGQQKVMPAFIQGSLFLYGLAIAPLLLMIYWLFRVRGPAGKEVDGRQYRCEKRHCDDGAQSTGISQRAFRGCHRRLGCLI